MSRLLFDVEAKKIVPNPSTIENTVTIDGIHAVIMKHQHSVECQVVFLYQMMG